MPHEYVILLEHTKLNSPHILGELQTLFTAGAVVQCSFKATIDIVRIFDNEWMWKFIIEFAHESWKSFEPVDLLSQWNKVALTDNLDGLYQKWFNWTCHYFNYWREWEGSVGCYHDVITLRTKLWHKQWSKQLSIELGGNSVQTSKSGSTGTENPLNWVVRFALQDHMAMN